jgi:hypothetical protein
VFNGLTALSLLLCAATTLLWVRSYRHLDTLFLQKMHPDYWRMDIAQSNRGRVSYTRRAGDAAKLRAANPEGITEGVSSWSAAQPSSPISWPGALGFWTGTEDPVLAKAGFKARVYIVPDWFLLLLTAVLPAKWLARWGRARKLASREARGLCPSCGYDLRGTPERCPECGSPVNKRNSFMTETGAGPQANPEAPGA